MFFLAIFIISYCMNIAIKKAYICLLVHKKKSDAKMIEKLLHIIRFDRVYIIKQN